MLPDEGKGKVFTEVIRTQAVNVVIQTHKNKIRGIMHKPQDNRLIDKLNKDDKFLPVTQVVIYDEEGTAELHRTDFLAVNCSEIIWLFEEPAQENK